MSYPAATLRLLPTPEPAPAGPTAPPQAINLIRAVLETMIGRRPLHQLRPHLAREAFNQLVGYRDSDFLRRASPGRMRTQMPAAEAVEATVQLACGGRWLSCAIRLDAVAGHWRCTDLMVLAPASLLAA